MLTAEAHVTVDPCERATCDWSGMHWHWGARRFRSISQLTPEECIAFDADLRAQQIIEGARRIAAAGVSVADLTTAPAGRRQPPERSTMPASDGYAEAPKQAMTEEESTERQQLGDAMQWLGLLHVDVDTLVRRTADRPLGQTLDDMLTIERSAEQLERIAQQLRNLRASLRDVVGGHIDTHDRERTERAQKEATGPSRPGWDR